MVDSIQILDIWRIIRQRILLIFGIALIVVMATGAINYFVLEPVYEATSTLIVQPQKESNRNQAVYNDILASQKMLKTYGEIAKSRWIAEDVIQKLKLNLTVDQLLNKLRVQSANESLITSITYSSNDPHEAVEIVNGFADSLYRNLNSIINVDNVIVLDQAKVNPNPVPVQPKKFMNMAIAFILGLMTGLALAFYLEFNDKTIKTEADIERWLKLPVMGVILTHDKKVSKKEQITDLSVGGTIHEIQTDKRQTDIVV